MDAKIYQYPCIGPAQGFDWCGPIPIHIAPGKFWWPDYLGAHGDGDWLCYNFKFNYFFKMTPHEFRFIRISELYLPFLMDYYVDRILSCNKFVLIFFSKTREEKWK